MSFFNIIAWTSLYVETSTETLVYSIMCCIQYINSFCGCFCMGMLSAILIAVFIIDRFTPNRTLRNQQTMMMRNQPYRGTTIDLAIERIFIGPNTVRYFLRVIGGVDSIAKVRGMLIQQGLFVEANCTVGGHRYQGLLFTHGIYSENGAYGSIQINPINFQILRSQVRITTGGGSEPGMVNDRLELFYSRNSTLQLVNHRSNL